MGNAYCFFFRFAYHRRMVRWTVCVPCVWFNGIMLHITIVTARSTNTDLVVAAIALAGESVNYTPNVKEFSHAVRTLTVVPGTCCLCSVSVQTIFIVVTCSVRKKNPFPINFFFNFNTLTRMIVIVNELNF